MIRLPNQEARNWYIIFELWTTPECLGFLKGLILLSDLGLKSSQDLQINIIYHFTISIYRSKSQDPDQFSAENRNLKITHFKNKKIFPIFHAYSLLWDT
jgi:hypothetical protein